ncbi:YciI family protein [Mariniflexile ostreae]|uniref:YciI family protein n=1 Tax=Mariniflexile ostreae TaxID=1520892 RepID=A0ABV5FCR4_9FLAO
MKNSLLIILILLFLSSCKNESKTSDSDMDSDLQEIIDAKSDSIIKALETKIEKSTKQIKAELKAKGYKTYDYIDEDTQDTILMQQYYVAFLKNGPIRSTIEEEVELLQREHQQYLAKMYKLGYADISGPLVTEDDIKSITIYSVPNLKMADSLAKADPMVQAGRLEVEVRPWWAAKGYTLR